VGIRLVVLIMVCVLAIEVAVLYAVTRRSARLPRLSALLPNLAAGLFLVLALGSATLAEPMPAVAVFVLLAGLAHAWDLTTRIRR
jgi:hypothetical protein